MVDKLCTINDFIQKVHDYEGIICFGMGKIFQNAIRKLHDTEIIEKIIYIVDNDVKKQGMQVNICGKNIEVISFECLKNISNKRFCILITCAKYKDILKQIEHYITKNNIDCYLFPIMDGITIESEVLKKKVPDNFQLSAVPLIPKTIHYCWFGNNPMSDKNRECIESWKKYCPDYRIIEWTEDNYDITKNQYMKQAYEHRKWAFVSDYARIDILYQYGGVYFDTDVELIQNIDDLLYQEGFMGFEGTEVVNAGLGVGAIQGLSIIKEILSCYDNLNFVNMDGTMNMVACPVIHTEYLKKRGLVLNGEYQRVGDLTIYPEKVLTGKNFWTRRIRLLPYTRAIHHYEGSWLERNEIEDIVQMERDMEGILNGNDIYSSI